MSNSNEVQLLLAFAFIVIAIPCVIGFTGIRLAKQNGTDIRVVWYLFSLAVTLTFITIELASSFGAIDDKGVFQGELGSAVSALLHFMLDLNADLKIFTSILVIVLVPQIASYMLSGLFGCASAPIFVSGAISFFIWGLVKSFVVAAGIILSAAVYGYFGHWNGWSLKGAASLISMSGLLLMQSFFMLYIYRDFHVTADEPSPSKFPKIREMVVRFRGWMTRNLP